MIKFTNTPLIVSSKTNNTRARKPCPRQLLIYIFSKYATNTWIY